MCSAAGVAAVLPQRDPFLPVDRPVSPYRRPVASDDARRPVPDRPARLQQIGPGPARALAAGQMVPDDWRTVPRPDGRLSARP